MGCSESRAVHITYSPGAAAPPSLILLACDAYGCLSLPTISVNHLTPIEGDLDPILCYPILCFMYFLRMHSYSSSCVFHRRMFVSGARHHRDSIFRSSPCPLWMNK
eukprot:GHVU01058776.1.p2 GENE.GHVU01058776.1~~GHVU01058776.1.p2  ORF type:complete len:106 (-),score=0.21 GHVU01058776.1:208-525(-)